jgi:hypothetical protein
MLPAWFSSQRDDRQRMVSSAVFRRGPLIKLGTPDKRDANLQQDPEKCVRFSEKILLHQIQPR